jgi:hypothetical protein
LIFSRQKQKFQLGRTRLATPVTFAALHVSRGDESDLAARQKHDRSDDDDDRVLRVCERRKRDETRGE